MAPNEEPAKTILSPSATAVAVATVALYAVLTVVLFFLAKHAEETAWSRYVYLYAGLEAIVFSAAGALFGSKVQRTQVDSEKKRADRAEQKAESVTQGAAADARKAAAGDALRKALEAEREVVAAETASASTQRRSARGPERVRSQGSAPIGTTEEPALERLAALADRLFEDVTAPTVVPQS